MAEDRLFQISFRVLFAQGKLSQYLGERTLKVDINMRDLGLVQVAEHIVTRMEREDPTAY